MGTRTVGKGLDSATGRKLLGEFKFTGGGLNAKSILGSITEPDPVIGTLKAVAFKPAQVKFPKGATFFLLHYGVLEYDLKENVFRFLPAQEPLEVAKEEMARELVLEVPEKPKPGRMVFGVMNIRFYIRSGLTAHASGAKGGMGIGIV